MYQNEGKVDVRTWGKVKRAPEAVAAAASPVRSWSMYSKDEVE